MTPSCHGWYLIGEREHERCLPSRALVGCPSIQCPYGESDVPAMREVAVRQLSPTDPVPALSVPPDLPAFLKLVADPNRLRIMALLAHGERCVCDLEGALGLPQNLVSHHLSVLKRHGLVLDRRDGKWVYYRVEPQTLGEQLGALNTLLDTRRARLRATPCAPPADTR